MIRSLMGPLIDIHGGGFDLVRCATKYVLHAMLSMPLTVKRILLPALVLLQSK